MGIDSQGRKRGACKNCSCLDFQSKENAVMCRCGHVPIKHQLLDAGGLAHGAGPKSYAAAVHAPTSGHGGIRSTPYHSGHAQKATGTGYRAEHYFPGQGHMLGGDYRHQYPRAAVHVANACHACGTECPSITGACIFCYPRGLCDKPGCTNVKYCDTNFGVFSYCSPACRDAHYLPGYNAKLQQDISEYAASEPPPMRVVESLPKASCELPSSLTCDSHQRNENGIVNASNLQRSKQITRCLKYKHDTVGFYGDSWKSKGLFVSKILSTSELHLTDIVIGVPSPSIKFDENMDYQMMISKLERSATVRVENLLDTKQMMQEIRDGMNDHMIAYFVPAIHGRDLRSYGLNTVKDHKGNELDVPAESVAFKSGLRSGNIIYNVGTLMAEKPNEFKLEEYTTEVFASNLQKLTDPAKCVGLVLLIEKQQQK